MVFAHDTEAALAAAVDLVNSADDPSAMLAPADLEAFFVRHGYSGRRDGTELEVAEVTALRPTLRMLLLAPRDVAPELVNDLLHSANAIPQLVRHEGYDWHVHAISDQAPLAARIRVETAMAMIDVIRSDEHSRLGRCADAQCDNIVLDLSRNRSKRYCSTACGNRNAVAAYRGRARS